jgi:cobalt-zinc-cadmium efflux system membrane fusion protein
VFLSLTALACNRNSASKDQHQHEHDEPKHAEAAPAESALHEHDHEELSRQIQVSEQVVRDARIEVKPATKAALSEVLTLPGEIAADPDRLARISTPAAGRIEAVNFREGDAVKKGQALIVIRVPEIAKARASHFASSAKAKAARANAARQRSLFEQRLAVEQSVLDAEAEAEALELEARSLRDELGALGAGTSGSFSLTLRSPIDGVVVARDAVVGQPAPADHTLASIADLSQVWFLARVFEKDLGKLELGATAEVHLNAYADEHFAGKVEYIGQQIDPVARTVNARVRLTNRDDLLRLGLFGTSQIALAGSGPSEPRLVIDRASVTEIGGKSVVFVQAGAGRFELHEVTLGRESLGRVEVLEGLREGEQVASAGVFSLKSILLKTSIEEHGH